MPLQSELSGVADEVDGGTGEHHTAGTVEVAGDDVDHIDQPCGRAAEVLRAGAEASVDQGGCDLHEGARQVFDVCSGDASDGCCALDGKRCQSEPQRSDTIGEPRQPTEAGAFVIENQPRYRRQQRRIGAGLNEQVLIGVCRGFRFTRVNNDEAPSPLLQITQSPLHARSAHETAIRRQRVGADDDKQTTAIDIWNRNEQLVAEHLQRSEHVGQLVQRRCRKARLGAEGAHKQRTHDHGPHAVHGGVALVDSDGISAVAPLHVSHASGQLVVGLFPAALFEIFAAFAQWQPKAVWVGVYIRQCCRLGAKVTVAQHSIWITLDGNNIRAVDLDQQPTHRFAQTACS